MGRFSWLSKVGRKVWRGAKNTVANVYSPIKKVVSTVHKGANFIDGLLDKAVNFGIPASVVDLIRDNPLYSTVHDAIEGVDDLVEKDLPRLGGAVENFVEHNVFNRDIKGARRNLGEIRSSAQGIIERGRSLGLGQLTGGFTPNRNPTSRAFIPEGASAV